MLSKSYETIKLRKAQHIAWITLDRPDKLNAMNKVMLKELSEAIDNVQEDKNVRCLVFDGKGERAFSTGADLKELSKLKPDTAAKFSIKGQTLFTKLENLPKPVIASIKGYALGGGLELALACDFRIAADNAKFGCPEIKFGFIPAWGGTQRLQIAVGLLNYKWLIMTGKKIQANEALRIGLVNRVVPLEKMKNEVKTLAQKLCQLPPEALKQTKKLINSMAKTDLQSGLKRETETFVLLFSSKETRKRIAKFGSKSDKK